jgi:hypothetical protein
MQTHIKTYAAKLTQALQLGAMQDIQGLGEAMREAWTHNRCA